MEENLNWALTFAELDGLLARVNAISDDRRTAFQARLKQFLKFGALPDVKQGRGRAANYEFGDVLIMSMLCEVTRLGLAPDDAIALVIQDILVIFSAFKQSVPAINLSTSDYMDTASTSSILIYFSPNQLRGLSSQAVHYRLNCARADFVQQHIADATSLPSTRQLSLVNATTLLRELVVAMRLDKRDGFVSILTAWAATDMPDMPIKRLSDLSRR